MATYTLTAITIGSFALGESDKILTLFSSERGIVRAVAKGARKPGTKSSGRSDVLGVNKLLLAKGKSLDIITQSEGMESLRPLRNDLQRLTYSLYYAELAQHFGTGLEQESDKFFEFLLCSLRAQSDGVAEAGILCLEFELRLLQLLGYQPEIDACVICRDPLTEYLLATFNFDLGGIVCERCISNQRRLVREGSEEADLSAADLNSSVSPHITPMVWKRLVLASQSDTDVTQTKLDGIPKASASPALIKANQAARRIIQAYIEHRAGRRMKSLDLIAEL